jgi:hypothetical protein
MTLNTCFGLSFIEFLNPLMLKSSNNHTVKGLENLYALLLVISIHAWTSAWNG